MLKRVTRFLREYRQLSFAIIVALVGGILDLSNFDTASHWVLGIGTLLIVIPVVIDMVKTLQSGHFGVDVLAITAIATSVALQEYWAGIIIVLMLTGGEALEDYATKRAKNELSSLLSNRPKKAHLLRGKKTEDVKVSEVNVGDKIIILAGEFVPVDGVIIEGDTSVDEASITGESLPISKKTGDTILSGAINIEGVITVKASSTAADSQYEQIIKLVRTATSGRSPFVRLADRYSVPFTAISFMIAGAAWFISGDSHRFLEVLVVATPCPLLIGAPVAIISGMSRASKHGVIIKTGAALERLAQVNTIAFDKTGTLTHGSPTVASVTAYGAFSKDEVLAAAAALEQSSGHILAAAIVAYAQKKKLKLQKAKQVKETAGHGLTGRLNGTSILVGHMSLLEQSAIVLPSAFKPEAITQTTTYVAIGNTLAGIITFEDKIREEAKPMFARLKKAGIRNFALVTGDNEAAAISVAKQLNITDVYPDCLPSEKMQAIEQMPGTVAFVGDGVNDAPVLTISDVGIALGARGSTAASETADVVIMLDDVSRVASSVEIAKRTIFIAKQSVLLGIIISIGLMILFATGRFTAVQGALVQEIVDVIVIFNALRAHGSMRKTT